MVTDWSRFDINKNGDMTKEEIQLGKEMLEIGLKEEKAQAQKRMAWVSLFSILIYASLPVIPFIPTDSLEYIAGMSDMLFITLASIIGFYFGATAYMSK